MSQTGNEAPTALSYKEALIKAAAFCAYQDRCLWDLRQKLESWQLSDTEEESLIAHLVEEGFLDEARFARSFARGRFYQKGWGKIKIRYELQRRQLAYAHIEAGLAEIAHEDYLEKIELLIGRKQASLGRQSAAVQQQKVMRYMQSKGYESDLIRDFLS